ncbi:type II toxin-antitoxin system VapC family toxin [Candidatus Methylobacter oryzae]|uniref:Type II toxin-antitoxin system VapC family toxin n=1 Tax=Candidatus Methylobacter oryzae TaxID=2497749 RepID=A0ABY3CEH0_9GAMM|nr:type II toxin-antitoxin system VapC family toxin [Candidatus Methylobacter oryzae]TRX01446.1 type II toxin-antitoxin system VapC family toxin [Candidatus Methylobacter oryzae]
MWLPDTNVWVRYLNPQAFQVKAHFLKHPAGTICLCDVGKAELYFGAFKSTRREENLALLDELSNSSLSLPFDGSAARRFGQIRTKLAKAGTPIGPYDLQIAAIALRHGAREFSRVANLNLGDWKT